MVAKADALNRPLPQTIKQPEPLNQTQTPGVITQQAPPQQPTPVDPKWAATGAQAQQRPPQQVGVHAGPVAVVGTFVDGQLETVNATAALKALLGNTKIDTTGTGVTIKNGTLSEAQFRAAVQTVFGDKGTLTADGSFKLIPHAGPEANLAAAFKAAHNGLAIDAQGALQLRDGHASGQLGAKLEALLGKNVLVSSGQVQFKDNAFVSAGLDEQLTTRFGNGASLNTTFKASIDREGLQSANATAAFKALIGSSRVDTTGTGLTIERGTLTEGQFKAAVETVFGPQAKLSTDGTFKWSKQSGVSADLVSSFKSAYAGLDGELHVKNGVTDAKLAGNIRTLLGPNTGLSAQGQVVFKDSHFDSAQLNGQLGTKFGPTSSLGSTFAASIANGHLASAEATAAFKALLGSTKIDTTGTGLSIKNDKLDQAQFKAAIETVLGPNAKLQADGSYTWKRDEGVSGSLAAAVKSVSENLSIDAGGNLNVKNGVASGRLQENIRAVLGSNTIVANNQVVFADNKFQSATLDDQLTAKFGDSASLDATFKGSVNRDGIASANATAAFKALIGSTLIDTKGSGLTITNNRLTDAQFKEAIRTQFGPNATLSEDGSFHWSRESGIDASVISNFKAARGNLNLDATGALTLKKGKVSGELAEKLTAVLGPNTLIANNQVVFKDNAFHSAALDDTLKARFGPQASLDANFKASIDRDGIQSATATAAFKALIGNTKVDTTGTGLTIENDKLTEAQFKAAVQTVFGPNAKLDADGTFKWKAGEGVSADVVGAFKGTFDNVSVDAGGRIAVKNGKVVDAELGAKLKATLGNSTLVSNNQIVFKDNGFQSAQLEEQLTTRFGKGASLESTFKASIDQSGVRSATATAAFKALLGGTSIDTTGTGLTIRNNQLSEAQFKAAVQTALGPDAKLAADGTFKWTKDSGVSAEAMASFKATTKRLELDASGNIAVKGGKVDATLQEHLKAQLGEYTAIADGKVVFKDSQFQSASLSAELLRKFGQTGSLDATLKATVDAAGKVDAAVGIAAFKRLKDIGKDGGIDIKADGSVVVKNNRIDRAEVSALLSVMAGKNLNLSTTGKLVYADGRVDTAFGANLKAAWDNTTLEGNGTLTVIDGKPQVKGQIGALFGGANVQGGASLTVDGVDRQRVDVKLRALGKNTQIDGAGSLVLDHGRIAGAGLTTNLVTKGQLPADISVGGLVSVTKDGASADLKAQVAAGALNGAVAVGGQTKVQLYEPPTTDKARTQVQKAGGVWAQRDASFELTGNVGVGGTVQVGAVPVTLGFKAEAGKKREVHTLSLHPSKEDALDTSPLSVIHPPDSVDKVLAMRPFEQYSDLGEQSVGFGGSASVGLGAGPASVKAGGSMYYQVTGSIGRDIERLEGDKVRVRFTRQGGSTDVKALSVSVGLDGGKVAGDNALAKKAAPIITQVAQAGLSAQWEHMKKNEAVFDATIDLSTPHGRAAMQHILNNELSEAQYWSGFEDSGVKLNSAISTQVEAKTRKLDLNLGTLNKEDVSRWLEKEQTKMTPKDFTVTSAVDQTRDHKALLPWNQDRRLNVRFVHETKVRTDGELPEIGETETAANLQVRVPELTPTKAATLADSEALLGMRVRLEGNNTGRDKAQKSVDGALAMMKQIGFQDGEYAQIDDSRNAIGSDLAPDKDHAIGPLHIGEKSQGKFAVDVEGFIGPKGFATVFADRGKDDFKRAYLDAAASQGAVVSTEGTMGAIEKTLGAKLVKNGDGYDVMKGKDKLGNLSAVDIQYVRQTVAGLSSNRDGFSASLKLDVGTWAAGKPPDAIVKIDPKMWGDSTKIVQRAEAFSRTMDSAGKLYGENQPPPKAQGESEADYQKRFQTWREGSLYDKPDAFYDQIDELFRKAVTSDKTPTTALAVMRLAGENHIYGKAQVEMQPDKLKTIIEKGRANVQRFGAVDLLAGLGARLDTTGNNLVISSAPENLEVATAAAKQLFGPNVQVSRNGGSATFSGLNVGKDQAAALARLLSSVTVNNGEMKLPSNWTAEQQAELLKQVFGSTAVVEDGKVMFDNRAYGLVHFGDALSIYGNGFGHYQMGEAPPRFPALVPIEDQGNKQVYDQKGLTARHQGKDARWGNAFSGMAYLRGRNEDLAGGGGKKKGAGDWILR